MELLPQLLRMMDVKTMTGSEGQRKLTLGNATILAYCLRWAGFRVRAASRRHHASRTASLVHVILHRPWPDRGMERRHLPELVRQRVGRMGISGSFSVPSLLKDRFE